MFFLWFLDLCSISFGEDHTKWNPAKISKTTMQMAQTQNESPIPFCMICHWQMGWPEVSVDCEACEIDFQVDAIDELLEVNQAFVLLTPHSKGGTCVMRAGVPRMPDLMDRTKFSIEACAQIIAMATCAHRISTDPKFVQRMIDWAEKYQDTTSFKKRRMN
jgi:hypothetical protein